MKDLLGLPVNASGQGAGVDHLIYFVHILMFTLFAGWISYFLFVLFRFNKKRNPKADYKGVTNHASTWVEIIVAGIEAALLIGLAIPIWAHAVDQFPKDKDATTIKIIAQQFQWNGWYPGTNNIFAKNDRKLASGENPFGLDKTNPHYKDNFIVAKDLVVPVNHPVIVYISSLDVIHSFSCKPMRVTQDAIPGMMIPAWFRPIKLGTYPINCTQLCGNSHYAMKGTLKVVSDGDYLKWVRSKSVGAGSGAGYE